MMMMMMMMVIMIVMMMHNMAENRKPFPLITPMIRGQSVITHVACDHMVIYYTRCCDQIESSLIVLNDKSLIQKIVYSAKDFIHQAHRSVLVFYTKYNRNISSVYTVPANVYIASDDSATQ